MSVILSILSALMYGAGDFSGGFASRRNSTWTVLVFSQTMGLALAFAAIPFVGGSVLTARAVTLGAIGGLVGAFGLFMLYRGMARTVVAIVSPVSALVSALLPMLYGAVRGERPSALAIAGAFLCLPAIFLLVWEKPDATAKGGGQDATHSATRGKLRLAFLYGLAAGIGFGLFFIITAQTPKNSGLWPLAAARTASLILFLVTALAKRERIAVAPRDLPVILAAGAFDMGANIMFLLASRTGLLFLVSCITSLYPGPTVVLASIFMGERLRPVRIAGILLALAGVALISAG